MAADGLAVKFPSDWLGKADDDPAEGVDPYWISTYQLYKQVQEDPYVKRARAYRDNMAKNAEARANKEPGKRGPLRALEGGKEDLA
jgi:hypothetical protein